LDGSGSSLDAAESTDCTVPDLSCSAATFAGEVGERGARGGDVLESRWCARSSVARCGAVASAVAETGRPAGERP
jgi:hypothetical protein